MKNCTNCRSNGSHLLEGLGHERMHAEHELSRKENALWHEELKLWQDELKQARDDLAEVLLALHVHNRALEKYGAALTLYGQASSIHEHALAEVERGNAGTGTARALRGTRGRNGPSPRPASSARSTETSAPHADYPLPAVVQSGRSGAMQRADSNLSPIVLNRGAGHAIHVCVCSLIPDASDRARRPRGRTAGRGKSKSSRSRACG